LRSDALSALQHPLRHGHRSRFPPAIPGAGYLRSDKRVLAGITRFIKGQDPDIVGLIEIDTGSIRTGKSTRPR